MYRDDFFKEGNVVMSSNDQGLIIKIVNGKPFNDLSFCGEVLQSTNRYYKEGAVSNSWDREYPNWKLCKGYNTPLYKALHGGRDE